MAKAGFDPIFKWFRGRIGGLVFRRAHNGKISVYGDPDMTRVKWSTAQKEHRRRMGEASKYASAAISDSEIRAMYVQMAVDLNKDPKRPFDVAVSDYYHKGNDLLWKKHKGDQEKPANWKMDRYSWYFTAKPRRR
jgi:hypothetical protein